MSFFAAETDAFLVSAAMNYFGMESVNDSPKRNVFSSNLHQGSMEEKRKWLCEHAANLFDQYLSDSVTELGDTHQVVSDQLEQEACLADFPVVQECLKMPNAESVMSSPNMGWYLMMLNKPLQCPNYFTAIR